MEVYDLWIGSGRVISSNLEAGQSAGPKYNPVNRSLVFIESCSYPIKSSLEELVIAVNGSDCGINYDNNPSTAAITFQKTDQQATGTLKFIVSENAANNSMNKFTVNCEKGVISGFSSVSFEEPLAIRTPETAPATWDENTQTLEISDLDESHGTISFGNSKIVAPGTSKDVFGDGKVVFDGEHTLTLNNANLGGAIDPNSDPEYMGINSSLPNLTIHIIGENSVYGGISGNSELDETCKLTFTAADGATLNIEGGDGAIWGFSEVNTDGTYLKCDEPLIWSNGGYWGSSALTVTKEVCYPMWVYKNEADGYVQVTAEHSTNILGAETATVSYTDGTLTMSNATIPSGSSYGIVLGEGVSSLNVMLVGENTIQSNGFSFVENPATLTFTTDQTSPGSLSVAAGADFNLTSADVTVVCENGLFYNSESKTVSALPAPTFSGVLNVLTNQWNVEVSSQQGGTIKYSLIYADESLIENNKIDETYTEAFTLLGPATITATVTVGETVSSTATAYYFGWRSNPVQFSYDGATAPTFAATLSPNVEGVTLTPTGVSQNIGSVSEGVLTISGMGKGTVWANITHPETIDYTIISDTTVFQINVLPPTPTIMFEETKDYLNTDVVSITLPEILAEDQNAVIKYSWVENCPDGDGTTYTDNSKVTLTAGTGTLYAWVRYNGATADDAVYSARVQQTFTVKSDINQAYIPEFTTTATYTGETITPEFTVYDSEKPQVALSADNYTVSYQKIGAQVENVDGILDAGTYVITITGTGDAWGGSKTVTREFTVSPADLLNVTIEDIADQTYTGSAIKPDVTVKLGDVIISSDQYTVEYSNNTDAGEATVTVTFTSGNFTTSEAALVKTKTFTIVHRTLEVTFASGQSWATYYNASESMNLPEGVNAYVVTDVSGASVSLQAISYVPAGKAVLLEQSDTKPTNVAESLTGYNSLLIGTSSATDVSSINGTVYVLYNGAFMKSTSGTIPANKAYLMPGGAMTGNGAPQMLTIDGGTTGIETVHGSELMVNGYYDLYGRKLLGKPTKSGLYIMNGKVVVNGK